MRLSFINMVFLNDQIYNLKVISFVATETRIEVSDCNTDHMFDCKI